MQHVLLCYHKILSLPITIARERLRLLSLEQKPPKGNAQTFRERLKVQAQQHFESGNQVGDTREFERHGTFAEPSCNYSQLRFRLPTTRRSRLPFRKAIIGIA